MSELPPEGNGASAAGAALATIVRREGPTYWAQLGEREVLCTLRGRLRRAERRVSSALVVGDHVSVQLQADRNGVIEAVKHPQDGAGVITSLTQTDGLAELNESITRLEPGATVGFLSYATLMG